jgi:hypothetical protein
MYSTCLYCHRDMGRNDVLDTLPVGRRIRPSARREVYERFEKETG